MAARPAYHMNKNMYNEYDESKDFEGPPRFHHGHGHGHGHYRNQDSFAPPPPPVFPQSPSTFSSSLSLLYSHKPLMKPGYVVEGGEDAGYLRQQRQQQHQRPDPWKLVTMGMEGARREGDGFGTNQETNEWTQQTSSEWSL